MNWKKQWDISQESQDDYLFSNPHCLWCHQDLLTQVSWTAFALTKHALTLITCRRLQDGRLNDRVRLKSEFAIERIELQLRRHLGSKESAHTQGAKRAVGPKPRNEHLGKVAKAGKWARPLCKWRALAKRTNQRLWRLGIVSRWGQYCLPTRAAKRKCQGLVRAKDEADDEGARERERARKMEGFLHAFSRWCYLVEMASGAGRGRPKPSFAQPGITDSPSPTPANLWVRVCRGEHQALFTNGGHRWWRQQRLTLRGAAWRSAVESCTTKWLTVLAARWPLAHGY